ncbi:MMPL family transporter [Cryptosporangium phraense]|uniref:MMPL family transporter n=1 Tax=Cryptosporangium phraense TaxID=2593070 RepID=A0A545API3_9ACTN|nr:MMPL family transporter [Cryptosporangium phraense]TQS42645.1 MMPL family transporter [Cryptosporangium phraense]
MAGSIERIGGFCARRRWWVLVAWIVILVSAVAGAARFAEPLTSEFAIAGMESTDTLDQVHQEFPASGADGGRVVVAGPLTTTDAAAVTALGHSLAAVPGVADVSKLTLAPGGRVGFFDLTLSSDNVPGGVAAAVRAARASGLQVEASSGLAGEPATSSSSAIGIVIALVVLLITFGSLVAAGLPLLTAILGLVVSLETIHAITALVSLNSVAPTLAILLGLAVGIDYALFVVNRHRQQLRAGSADVTASIAAAMGTAGTAVFYAALTVIAALAGLAVVRIGFLTQMGLAAAGAVLVAMVMSLTLTPALLAFAGRRIVGRRRAAGTPHRFAHRWAAVVTRYRVVAVIGSVLVLAVLAIPVAGLRLNLPDDGTDPSSATDRKAYDLIADGFGPGANGPLLVLTTDRTAAARIAAVDDVARVVPSGVHGDDVLLTVIPASGPSDEATATLVRALRDDGWRVTGQTAVAIDISQRLANALPVYLALVVGFAFVLLLAIFRSILIPLTATLSFLLSLGAALGCTVAVFQWGWLGSAFGVDPAAPLLSFLPILVIGVLFGLSMDYEMFLVSGMREEFASHGDAQRAVTSGFARGAMVVVAAALIMIGVFGGGVVRGDGTIRPIAFALGAGVLTDAFVVRLVLVPATMALLGRAAWWLPGRALPGEGGDHSSDEEEQGAEQREAAYRPAGRR